MLFLSQSIRPSVRSEFFIGKCYPLENSDKIIPNGASVLAGIKI